MHELLVGKYLGQYWQPKGFSLVWTLRWRARSDGRENFLWQIVQCVYFLVVEVWLMVLVGQVGRYISSSEMESEEVGEVVPTMSEKEEVGVGVEVEVVVVVVVVMVESGDASSCGTEACRALGEDEGEGECECEEGHE